MTVTNFEQIDAEQMRIAAAGVVPVPFEQSAAWEAFSHSQGHRLWGRYAWKENDKIIAVIALYEYNIRRVRFLWAKNGPVWLKEATPSREAAFRSDLRHLIRTVDKGIAFVRLNAWYQSEDLVVPLQTISYDRTVRIQSCGADGEAMMANMSNSGRRSLKKARKRAEENGYIIARETISEEKDFEPFYKVMLETAQRDGFRPHPMSVYVDMLTTIDSDKARLYSVRDSEGQVLCWDLVLIHDLEAQVPYGASTAEARKDATPSLLDFEVTRILGEEGVRSLDLMGIHSPRCPELYGVGRYKMAFSPSYTDVPGGWDMPVKKRIFGMLQIAKNLKERLG